jgi:hypothetical protein
VRGWAVRLACDDGRVSPSLLARLETAASAEDDLRVRSQLAASARRLPPNQSLPLVAAFLGRDPEAIPADGDDIHVVGVARFMRVRWTGAELLLDKSIGDAVYRTLPGQTHGWDAVIDAGAAWFLDDGAGSERYAGSFRGIGISECPLHLVRVGLVDGAVSLTEVCGLPLGLIANPPAVDPVRRVVVGYDSANGIVTAFRFDDDGATSPLWTRPLHHAAHPLRFADTGELVLCDHDAERGVDQVVVVDIETGAERGRVDTGSPVQSVLFLAPGFDRDLYVCSFAGVARITVG